MRDRAAAHRERQGAEGAAARRAGRACTRDRRPSRTGCAPSCRRGSRRAGPTARVSVLGAGNDDLEAGRRYLARARGFRARGAVVADGVRRARRDARAEVAIVRRELGAFDVPDLYPVPRRARARRPDAARPRHARAVRALAAADRDRRGDLVPAVLRAGRRLRPRRARRHARTPTATSGACTARRSGRAGARTRSGDCCSPATTRRVPEAPGHHRVRHSTATPRVSRCGRCAR